MSFGNYKNKINSLIQRRYSSSKSPWAFNKLNNLFGWIVFLIALLTYCLTLEPTTSFWDCGEYIATAYKLQVGHPPGAPLYLILGNFFANLGFSTSNAAFMINLMSAICSAFTILFLFWSITLLAKKNFQNNIEETKSKYFIILSGLVGSLVYTFSDSFWFSAVEGEVYAMSSLFTALVFWSILKWEDGFESPRSSRWLVFISFLIGLSIGVHMLNLLAIPAITVIYCYKKQWLSSLSTKYPDNWFLNQVLNFFRFTIITLLGILLLYLIYNQLIPGIVSLFGKIEIYFINALDLPINSGTIFFFGLIIFTIIGGLFLSHKKQLPTLNTILLSFSFFLIGYSLFLVLIIRSNANTPIDENNPEDAVSLLAYLNREQYGSNPVFYGAYFNSDIERDFSEKNAWDGGSFRFNSGQPVYTKGYLIKNGLDTIKECFSYECADTYQEKMITEKYLISDERKRHVPIYESREGEIKRCNCLEVKKIELEDQVKALIVEIEKSSRKTEQEKQLDVQELILEKERILKQWEAQPPGIKGIQYKGEEIQIIRPDQTLNEKGTIKGLTKKVSDCHKVGLIGEEIFCPYCKTSDLKLAPVLSNGEEIVCDNNKCNSYNKAVDFIEQGICYKCNQACGIKTLNEKVCFECGTSMSGNQMKKERDIIQQGFFPRMWSPQKQHIQGYLKWANIEDYDTENPRATTFLENFKFFWNYQINHMYIRYFMWNFSGKQNDIQGHGDLFHGNWLTGINFIDNHILGLGPQKDMPSHIKSNKGRNTYFLLPFILGIIGLCFQANRQTKDFGAIFLLFFFTGIAIAIQLNQTPFQPRERDYAYVGSFYAFSIWIGFGALAILDFARFLAEEFIGSDKVKDLPIRMAEKMKNATLIFRKAGLITLSICLLAVPTLMAIENWDDHDRSDRYTARDFAKNYLKSCEKNGILFNMGDNDTFPLWYIQEVENYRTDLRLINLSLLNTDWYINQIRKKAYEGKGVELSIDPHIYRHGGNIDQVQAISMNSLKQMSSYVDEEEEVLQKLAEQLRYGSLTQAEYDDEILNRRRVLADSYIGKEIKMLNGIEDLKKADSVYKENGGDRWSLKKFNEWIKSEESYTFIQTRGGDIYKYYPNSVIVFDVNEEYKAKLKQENPELDIEDEIEIKPLTKFNTTATLSKNSLMILNLLEANDWERPVYFANSIGRPEADNQDFLFLYKYLQLDGLVYKLTPIKNNSTTITSDRLITDFQPGINTKTLYDNLMAFEWGGIDKKNKLYLDETNLRMIRNIKGVFVNLIAALLEEEKHGKAKKVAEYIIKSIPHEKVPLQDYDLNLMNMYLEIIQKGTSAKKDYKKIEKYINLIFDRYFSEIKYYSSFSKEELIDNKELVGLLNEAVSTITTILQIECLPRPGLAEGDDCIKLLTKENRDDLFKEMKRLNSKLLKDIDFNIEMEALLLEVAEVYKYQDGDDFFSHWIIENKKTNPIIRLTLLETAFNWNEKKGAELLMNLYEEFEEEFDTKIKQIKQEANKEIEENMVNQKPINRKFFEDLKNNILLEIDPQNYNKAGSICQVLASHEGYKCSKQFIIKAKFDTYITNLEQWMGEIDAMIDDNDKNMAVSNIEFECNCLIQYYDARASNNTMAVDKNCISTLQSLLDYLMEVNENDYEAKKNKLSQSCPEVTEMFFEIVKQEKQNIPKISSNDNAECDCLVEYYNFVNNNTTSFDESCAYTLQYLLDYLIKANGNDYETKKNKLSQSCPEATEIFYEIVEMEKQKMQL